MSELPLSQMPLDEIFKEEEPVFFLYEENIVVLNDMSPLLEGFTRKVSTPVGDKIVDVFVNGENFCAVLEYDGPYEYDLTIKNAKIRIRAHHLSRIEIGIYSENSVEMEVIDLKPFLKYKATPIETIAKRLYKELTEPLTRYLV